MKKAFLLLLVLTTISVGQKINTNRKVKPTRLPTTSPSPTPTPEPTPTPTPTPIPTPTPTTSPTSTYSANTDRITRPNAFVPDLGGQGYTFADPVYGTRILRVTDGNSIAPASVNRSFITSSTAETRTWNADSTKFWVMDSGGGVFIYSFDAATFSVSRPGNTSNSVKGLSLYGQAIGEPFWSPSNPNHLYAFSAYDYYDLVRFDVTGATDYPSATTVLDIGAIYTSIFGGTLTGYPSRVTVASDIVSFCFGGSQDTWKYFIRYDLTTGDYKILDTSTPMVRWYDSRTQSWTNTNYLGGWRMHNARMDLTGRYLIPTRTAENIPLGEGILQVWDTVANTLVNISLSDNSEGHMAAGYGMMVNFSGDCCPWDSTQWWLRSLSNLSGETRLISTLGGGGMSVDEHSSWHNARPDTLMPIISATYRYANDEWRAWDGELLAIRTDGISTVWRFMQHNSVTWNVPGRTTEFQDIPIPQVSPDGKWCLIHTNWNLTLGTDAGTGKVGRSDVFLVELK